FFFFSSRRRHTRFDCDWSSDVCSSDLSSVSVQNSERTSVRTQTPASPATPVRVPACRAARAPRGLLWFEPDQARSEAAAPLRARSEERRVGKECRTQELAKS